MPSTKLTPAQRVRLNNGTRMPLLGLGTWGLDGDRCYRTVREALSLGYRHIDTATMYRNEEEVGRAVRDSGLRRNQVFITTKVASWEQGYEGTLDACRGSLQRLGVEAIDLYLIHWPVAGKNVDTWRAMEELLAKGRCRAIGVSNFSIPQLEELMEKGTVVPAVNQIELNPFVYDREMLDFCDRNGIQVIAYSPLTRGTCLQERTLLEVAQAYRKSAAQVLLRWALQKGVAVIPKASSVEHLRENRDVFDFELYNGDMDKLDALDTIGCIIDR